LLSADERLIEAARNAARGNTALNEQFRCLETTRAKRQAQEAMQVIEEMRKTVRTGGRNSAATSSMSVEAFDSSIFVSSSTSGIAGAVVGAGARRLTAASAVELSSGPGR
jgi:1-aminocyclopropane-1-carboxylate deaminase/D-cysteine desulfhydrase-like pyridoxal-dependent ACC family enzyme